MATYTYILTTEVGKVRLKIGDRDIDPVTDAQFQDEELDVFLDEAADLGLSGGRKMNAASGFALIAWAVLLARDDELVRTGSWTGDTRDVAGKMNAKAQEYLDLAGVPAAIRTPVFQSVPVDWTADVTAQREAQG